MIKHLPKIIGFNTSFNVLQKAEITTSSAKNSVRDFRMSKLYTSFFSFSLILLFSFSFCLQNAFSQCTPTISIQGGNTVFCVSQNTNLMLSVDVLPARDTFFGSGVTDVNNTDHIGMFNPSVAGVGMHDIFYQVQADGPDSCVATNLAKLSVTVAPIANAGIDGTAFVCQETGATIDLFSGLSGTPNTTGTWATAAGVTPSGYLGVLNDTQIGALPLGATDFFYTDPGMPDCPDSTSKVTLTVTNIPTVSTITANLDVCEGNSAIVTINGLADKDYIISYRINGIDETDVPLTSSLGTGTFFSRVLATADNGLDLTVVGIADTSVSPSCDTTAVFFNGTLNVTLQPEIQSRDTAICSNQQVDLSKLLVRTVAGDSLEFGTSYGMYGAQSDSLVTLTMTDTFYVRDSLGLSGCMDTTRIIVTVFEEPNIEGRDTTICNTGNFDLRILLTGDSVSTLEYGLGTFGTYNLPSGVVNPGAVGNYTYYVRDSILVGCVDTAEITLMIDAQPEITGRDTSLCDGEMIDLSKLIVRTSPGDSIVYKMMGGMYGVASDSLDNPSIGVTTYIARDSLASSMCSDTAIINITVEPLPQIQGKDTTICSGQSIDLNTLVTRTVAGDSLEYGTAFGTYGTMSNLLTNLTVTDTFYVRDSVGAWVCSDTTRIIVTVIPAPELVGSDIAICAGDSVDLNTLLTRTATGDSLEFGTIYGVFGPQIDSIVMPSITTPYFIRDSIGSLGCADTAMITVNVSPKPLITGRDTSICRDQLVDLKTLITTNGSVDSLEFGTSFGSYLSSNLVNPSVSTTYFLRDSNKVSGCFDTTQIVVNIFTSPDAVISSELIELCSGDMDTLSISPTGGTFSFVDTTWLSDNLTAASVVDGIITAGNVVSPEIAKIRYVIEDTNGCQDTSDINAVTVIAYPQPTAGDITGDTSLCLGTTTTLMENSMGGTGPTSISWFSTYDTVATVDAAGLVTAINPGLTDIYYTVSDSKSCEAVSNVFDVRVDTFPTIVFNVSDADSTICNGDSVTFTASGGMMYEFLLNAASLGAASPTTTYGTTTLNNGDQVRVVVTNMNGCVDTSGTIIMTVDTIPIATLVSDDADNLIGTGQNVIFTAGGGTDFEFFVNNSSVQGQSTFDTFTINTIAHLDTIMVQVEDGNMCVDTASLVMIVNTPPIALNDTVVIVEDTPAILIAVQDNDMDPETDALITTIITPASNGLDNTLNNDTIQYIPNLDFNGLDTIIYQVCDPFSNCDTASVFITVTPINDAPIASHDTLYLLEDAPISIVDVQINDVDPDGDSLITSISTSLGLGTALVVMNDSISYIPSPDSSGMDIVVYQVCDTAGLCDVGLLRIFITPVNDAPVATKDSITINEDSMNVSVAILTNDLEADGDVILIDSVYAPTSGGTAIVSNDTIIYNPPTNFNGLDSIQYAICDTALCDTTYLIINVLPINETPVAVKDSVTIPEDTTQIKIAILTNDIDVDGDIIMIDSVFVSSQGLVGSITNDTLCYTPIANFNGIDSLKYIITDGTFKDSTYVIINVLSVNDAPIAVNDTVTVPENANPAIIPVQANDSDPDGNLFATTILTGPSNGSAVESGGNVNYTPTASFNGMDTITYRICDTEVPSQCDTATIFITVSGINDAPVALNDTLCIAEDTVAILLAVEMNDSDVDADPLTVTILTGATQSLVDSIRNDTLVYQPALNFNGLDSVQYQVSDGTLVDQAWVYIKIDPRNDAPVAVVDSITVPEDTTNVNIAVTINDYDVDNGDSLIVTIVSGPTSTGTVSIINDTTIAYNPPVNFNGLDTIDYQVCDTSNVCDMARVIVTVQPVSDKPIAVDDAYTVPEDTTNVVINVQLNDTDGDGDVLTTRIVSTFMMADTLNGDSIIFTPTPDSANVQLIAYEICDTSNLCDTAVVTITVIPVNDAPIAVTDVISINQDTTNVGIAATANDIDIDDTDLTITAVINPSASNGSATILGVDSILYTPLAGFSGLDTIHYTVCDTSNACDMGMVLITVGFINTPPTAVDDILTGIAEDATNVPINVILNDSDINGMADSLKVTMVTSPISGGTAVISGDSMILYTPPADFNGMDSVQYTVCDTSLGCANAWIFFTVDAVNDKPVANRDTIYVSRDTTNALLLVKANDMDVDGDVLTVMTIGNSTQGVIPAIVNDSIQYSAPAGYVGVDEITYKVTDTGGLMDTTTLTIVINDPNNLPPVANTDFGTTTPGNGIFIDVQSNDIEPNGDSLITTIISNPYVGNVALVLNNDSIQYTPAITFAGADTIIYKVCDPSLTCDTDTVFILVENTLAVSARVILEGPYDATTTWMHDSLRVLGFIPTTEPYSTLPSITGGYQFVHKGGGGNESISSGLLDTTGGNAIVDWVYLELLGAADTIPVASRSALLQRDGDIVDVDGVSPVGFDLLPNGDYFLSVRHRNHLGVMTDTAYAFSMNAFTTIDFSEQQSTGGAAIFGEHPVDTISSRLVLWAGDGNSDREIKYSGLYNDRDPVFFEILTAPENTEFNFNHVSFGYHIGDYDMKGSAIYLGSGNDPDVIFFNVFLHPKNNLPGNTPTVIHIIREQIPR